MQAGAIWRYASSKVKEMEICKEQSVKNGDMQAAKRDHAPPTGGR